MKNSTYLVRRILIFVCLVLFTLQNLTAQQVAKSLTGTNGVFIGFYEYKPTDYTTNPSSKYPVIIFLHGIGERGNGTTDLKKVKANAIPKLIDKGHKMKFFWNGKWQTFLVLSPQLATSYGSWKTFYVEEMIQYAKANLNVDTNRIFLTGLSLGGGGVWSYASASFSNASKLAAIAPVCGICSMSKPAHIANADLPVWAFHAENDPTVKVGCTHNAVNNINAFNPSIAPIKTIYPDGGHGIWNRSYDTSYKYHEPTIYEWFLGQDKSLAPNVLPIANAGRDLKIFTADATVTLNGQLSRDADGKIVKFIWRKLSGPEATIADRLGAFTVVTGMTTVGNYEFELTVIDNRSSWTKDTVRVTVEEGGPPPNKLPIARAGNDVQITLPINYAQLDGSGSFDADGSIASVSWSKISGPAGFSLLNETRLITDVSSLVAGKYEFELKVTDNQGAVAKDTVIVTVKPATIFPNKPPVAKAGTDVEIQLPTNAVSADGSESTDPDGLIKLFSWYQISGPVSARIQTSSAALTDIEDLEEGVYEFVLKVTDDKNSSATDTMIVTVKAAPIVRNELPLANAGADILITLPANQTILNGELSNDPDGSITGFNWKKISGPGSFKIENETSETSELKNLVEGHYEFELTVTDDKGATATDTVRLTVNPAPIIPNESPFAKAGTDITITLPANTITVNGSSSYDPDGDITTYQWSKISGPALSIVNSSSVSSQVKSLVEGVYKLELKVSDDDGAIAKDTIIVTVLPAPPPPNEAPVSNAGTDQSIALPANSVSLDGGLSYDVDGTLVSYKWNKISGPASYSITNPGASKAEAKSLTEGTYLFELIVTDDDGAIAKDTVVIKVDRAPNKPPVADAGTAITITLPVNTALLDATKSRDSDGTISSFEWKKIAGPVSYRFVTENGMQTEVNALTEGTYKFEISVKDNEGAISKATVQVVVKAAPIPNQAPIAAAGSDIELTLPSNSATLNGSASSDPDGSITSFVWRKISGPANDKIVSPNEVTSIFNSLSEGTYSVELEVTDNKGLTAKDTLSVVVHPIIVSPNKFPVAKAGNDLTITLPVNGISLDGATSNDPDGSIVSYLWKQLSGPAGSDIENPAIATTRAINLVQGTYVYELQVTDNQGASAADQVTVVVKAAPIVINIPPTANAGADQQLTMPVNLVALNGSGSTDNDGSIVSYSWIRTSGPGASTILNSTTKTPTVIGLQAGQYTFQLTVTDNSGATATDDVVITVIAEANMKPVAIAGNDTSLVLPVSRVFLNGLKSYDPDGQIAIYAWRQISGGGKLVLPETNSATVELTGVSAGIYEVELMVKDNRGASSRDTVKVTIVDHFRYEENLRLAPNPARSQVQVTLLSDSSGAITGRIYNSTGVIVLSFGGVKAGSVFQKHIDVSSLPKGFYFIELLIGNRKKMITQLMKQ